MKEVIIYGAGKYGKSLYNAVEEAGDRVLCFIDEYSSEKEFCCTKIQRVEELDVDKNIEIYISIALNDVSSIKKLLIGYGFHHIFVFEDTVKQYSTFLKHIVDTNLLWMSQNRSELVNIEKIKEIEHYFSDDSSKELLNKIVQFRTNLTYDTYVQPQLGTIQYFPDDIDLFSHLNKLKFVDCGAYIGDTIETVIKNFKKVDYIISIEPDKQNLEKLKNEIKKQKAEHYDIDFCVYPCGVWSENKILKFSSDGNSASSVTNDTHINTIEISAISLDDTLFGLAPNYIKMDVEGAEAEALKGSEKIITTYKPILAVCVYHKPSDLWELPILIKSFNPNYKMYLRQHGHMGMETVLYCVDKKF